MGILQIVDVLGTIDIEDIKGLCIYSSINFYIYENLMKYLKIM